jgi:hypothetical protein
VLKGKLPPFVSALKWMQYAKRDWLPHAKSKKIHEIKEYCMQQLDTFLQLANGS